MNKARFLFPITKVDEAQRLVWGRITEEVVDKANEVLDYESSKPFFEKWSADISKATDGKSLGNVRAMHQPIAAGKLTSIDFLDAEKAIDCCAKIVDDAEWAKVEAGVYTGFSMGGNYVRRWDDPEQKGIKRFTANPVEVSIVDNPCVPTAHFSLVKADGTVETRPLVGWTPTNDEVGAEAVRMAKEAGGDAHFGDYLVAAREALVKAHAGDEVTDTDTPADPAGEQAPADGDAGASGAAVAGEGEGVDKTAAPEPAPAEDWGIDQVFRVRADGSVHDKKAEARKHVESLKVVVVGSPSLAAAIAAARAGKAAQDAAEAADPGQARADLQRLSDIGALLGVIAEKHEGAVVAKGMYGVGRFSEIIASLGWLATDEAYSVLYGDEEPSAGLAAIVDGLRALVGAFLLYAAEECAELLGGLANMGVMIETLSGEGEVVEAGARALTAIKADAALLEKVGARNSKADAGMIQAMHDTATKLGAACATADKAAGATATDDPLQKVQAERDALAAQIAEALPGIADLGQQIAKLTGDLAATQAELTVTKARLEEVAAEPEPMPAITPDTRRVAKSDGDAGGNSAKVIADAIEELGIDRVRDAVFKHALNNPVTVRDLAQKGL